MRYWLIGGLASAACIWYMLPLPLRIVNQGNKLGIPLMGLIILYCLLHKPINALVKRLWVNSWFKAVGWAAIGVCGVAVLTVLTLSVMMVFAAGNGGNGTDVAIVLGCATRNEIPSLSLRYRLDEAIEYLDENPDSRLIVSGGVDERPDAVKSEAQVMAEYLIEHGVDESKITLEDASMSTRENLENSYAFIGEDETVTIISSDYHVLRGKMIAKKLGHSVKGRGSKTMPNLFLTYYTRELMALVFEAVLEPW